MKWALTIAAFVAAFAIGCSDDGIYEAPPVDAGVDVCVASTDKDGPGCEEPTP